MWGARSCLHRGGNRGEADRAVEQRGSPLPWSADDWCETPPPFRGSLLGATTGLFVLMRLHECLTLLGFFSDRVISLVCRTFWHCAISKVDVHHVQGDLHRDSHGQVRSVMSMWYLSDFSNEKLLPQTVLYNFISVLWVFSNWVTSWKVSHILHLRI